jgi:hypothetical protein
LLVRKLGIVALLLGVASWAPRASAQDKPVEVSVGYAFAKYLEEDTGSAPVGAYLSLSGTKRVSFELDLGWQRDSEDIFNESLVLNTFTATLGPRFRWGNGGARPYLHLLGGLRYDSVEDESNTAWGGQTGAGVDIPLGESVALRLGADFQIFFDEGENVKTLRLLAGLTF